MALPRFFERALDAASGLPVSVGRDGFAERIGASSIALRAADAVADDPAHRAGFLLAANLAARLYPAMRVDAPAPLADAAADLIRAINPLADIDLGPGDATVGLDYGRCAHDERSVSVTAAGWAAALSLPDPTLVPAAAPAALAAATLGMAEVFRIVVGDMLPPARGRRSEPAVLDLLSWSDVRAEHVPLAPQLDLGRTHLAGAGAVGEAAVLTLSTVPVSGTLFVIEPEALDLSNLQRYVLAVDSDIGADSETRKIALVERALDGHGLAVEGVPTRWGADDRSGPRTVETVLVALDTRRDRIGVAAGLPGRAYNAWTQPLDLGWSRHERFGREPCLACLYWPQRPRPSEHERIAAALRIAADRVALYLVNSIPIGQPLPPAMIAGAPVGPTPADARATWATTPLLDDLLARPNVDVDRLCALAGAHVRELYREACGGGMVGNAGDDEELAVPLAHQSVLAGIMLATLVITATDPVLAAARTTAVEGRLDVLSPLPQRARWPVARAAGCICSDPDFGGTPSER